MTRLARFGRQINGSVASIDVLALLIVLFVVGWLLRANVSSLAIVSTGVIYGLAVASLDLLVGYAGQLSVGQAGLFAVGAYATAISEHHFALPLPVELLFAGAVTALAGLILGAASLRLKGHYFTLVTLGFGLAVPQLALNLSGLTGGYTGLETLPAQLGGLSFATPWADYNFSLVIVAGCLVILERLLRTSSGRAIMSVRDSELASAAYGVNVFSTKIRVFLISSFFTGIAGDLFAHFNNLVSPSSFGFTISLFFLAAVVVGGSGARRTTLAGSLVGALALAYLQQRTASLGGVSEFVLGVAVIAVALLFKAGLWSLVDLAGSGVMHAVRSFRRRGRGSPAPATSDLAIALPLSRTEKSSNA